MSSNAEKFASEVDVTGFPGEVLPDQQKYEHPLVQRYATKEMSAIWSPAMKFTTWRKLWLALATAEQELGLHITDEQLDQMRAHLYDVDFAKAEEYESKFRHDVMGHVHAFGEVAPLAMPIIHLGATSCYVGDNTDIIQLKEGLKLVRRKLVQVLAVLKDFAQKYRDLPTLGFTHYQPAQLTTVGKRCTLWMQDLLLDYERVCYELENLPMRGVKGTTGTQATFLELFDGDHEKVKLLNQKVCSMMGFDECIPVSGQTYTRKIDFHILSVLSGIAQSAYKMCGDIRLLANLKEVEEPFAKNQIGSSAMAYKRNPMRSERVCSLARYIMSLPAGAANTHANQWFERTLDDSAIRRIILPEGFLAVDVVLNLLQNIADGMVVWPRVVEKHVMDELPFMATEVILMECVKAGGDRQELHEAIRVHSMDAGKIVKSEGKPNDLLERIATDPLFASVHSKLESLVDPKLFVGRSVEQVDEFLADCIVPMLEKDVEERKKWLNSVKKDTFLNYSEAQSKGINYSEFINRELVLFSQYDNVRSIPHIMDGFKPSQRKVLYACFKKKLKNEIKVAQLAGYIGEHSAYHHGDMSLNGTIIGMAQSYCGSNNVNLLYPSGQFGTRRMGGKDHASARYIFTRLEKIARTIFHPDDDPLLTYLNDDGLSIEPEYYMPVIPLVLVNGSDGIGTGWSSTIQNHNPRDVISNIRKMINGEEPEEMHPYFSGYTGEIIPETGSREGSYIVKGRIERIDDTSLLITELPIGKWTQDYKAFLETMMTGTDKSPSEISDFKENHTDTTVSFTVIATKEKIDEFERAKDGLHGKFKLTTTISTKNMNLFDTNGKIHKYKTSLDILRMFFGHRLEFYIKRKAMLLAKMKKELKILENKARFVEEVCSGHLVVSNRKRKDLLSELQSRGYDLFPKDDTKEANEDENDEESIEEDTSDADLAKGYEYLLGMKIWSLTFERAEQLRKERAEKAEEVDKLDATSPETIWLNDLDAIEEALDERDVALQLETKKEANAQTANRAHQARKKAAAAKKAPAKKVPAKKAPTKKAAVMDLSDSDGDDDDDDDDFSMPKPTPAQTEKVEIARNVSKGAAIVEETTSVLEKLSITNSDQPTVTAKKSAPAKNASKKAPAKKKPAPKKKKYESDSDDFMSDSDSDVEIEPTPAPSRARSARAASKVTYIIDSDSEEEEFDEDF